MKKIIIYTSLRCAHCEWAKELLNKKKIEFIEYNISKDSSKIEEMQKKTNGARTVPQIFIGDYHVGGNRELQALEKGNKLDNLLKS